jgi:AAA family ATP:ADP antiporter
MDDPAADAIAVASPLEQRAQRVLRPLADVYPHEVGALLAAFALFFCLLASYYLLRPLRDAMGLVGGAGNLPRLFITTFAVMLLATVVGRDGQLRRRRLLFH